jgi:MFS family permease
MDANIDRYPWYAALYNAFFWMPVFFLFFSRHLQLGEVLTLEAIYYTATVALEVPSGYVSDTYGRRRTLIASSLLLVTAYSTFFVATSFAAFAAAQVALAGGIAFQSGTGTSFHFDSLAATGRDDEYENREGIVTRNSLAATALAAVVGGLAASWNIRLAYLLSGLAAVGALALTWSFTEPPSEDPDATRGFGAQLVRTIRQLDDTALVWLFGYAVVMTMLNHVPYEFYQPYLDLAGRDLGLAGHTPAVTGLHMGLTTLLGATLARRGVDLDERIGTGPTLLIATLVQIVVIGGMALVLHPLLALLILLRGIPKALAAAPLRAAVTPRLEQGVRATYLSVQSLVGRLGFAGLLATLGAAAGSASPESWPTLSLLLTMCAGFGAAAFAVLAATRRFVEFDAQEVSGSGGD